MLDINTQLDIINKGVDEIIPMSELIDKLRQGRPLIVKVGFDPTSADIHLGHMVVIMKMRQLQDIGHKIKFLIGDFTALIGDPTGKNATRPPLSKDQINQNATTYAKQVFKILDPQKTEVCFNSNWLSSLGADGMLKLASTQTVARMLERDDFSKRFSANKPIAIHEFMYPLLQGYDSVAMEADIELGGTDQKFNLLMGRELQKQHNKPQQCILMMPLLEGLDGVNKMSKSLGNYIGITEPANDMFGKIMSISDDLMWRYYELLSLKHISEIDQLKKMVQLGHNPRQVKVELAMEIIDRLHSHNDAVMALHNFELKFKYRGIPDDIEIVTISSIVSLPIGKVLWQSNLVGSISEGLRMIDQGGVKIDGEKITDKNLLLLPNKNYTLQVGKRKFVRVVIK